MKLQRAKRNSLVAGIVLLVVGIPLFALGDSSTLTLSGNSVTVTSTSSTTLDFPITRTGDTTFDAFVQYQTTDGTAVGGVNYTAANGSVVIPAGESSAMIPVTILGSSSLQQDETFQLQLLGSGGGAFTASFATQQTFATGNTPYSVAAADVNGDGVPDLIVANSGGNTVSVLLNTTTAGATIPSFATQQTFATGNTPYSVTAVDVNGDGMPDLIVANSGGNTVSVLLNTTTPGATIPSFAAQQTFAVGATPFSVKAVDLNGDGKPDLIVANSGGNTVSVLLNTTTAGATAPSFATQQTFATGNTPHSVTAVDVNGDGKPDLIVANSGDGTVSVLLNTTTPGATTPSFATQQTFATGNTPHSVTAVDVNGDGKPDLIVANSADDTASVLLNTTAPGATTPSFATQQTFATGNTPYSVTAADVNGDGKPDVIVANQNDNTVSVLLNTITAPATTFDANSFATGQTFATGSYPYEVATADVNSDGRPDLIVTNYDGNTVGVLLNTTALSATTPSFATQQRVIVKCCGSAGHDQAASLG
ncbi:MAG: FG-GAP-like repeat-containing protein [Candidatus Binataceae bacterium]